jgi:hypothetical protein
MLVGIAAGFWHLRPPGRMRRAGAGGQGLNEEDFNPADIDKMLARLEALRTRHRDLDQAIEQLQADGGQDFKVMTLKREKLLLKDHIAWLSSKLTPDIIA